jgi:hypothetical protein
MSDKLIHFFCYHGFPQVTETCSAEFYDSLGEATSYEDVHDYFATG